MIRNSEHQGGLFCWDCMSQTRGHVSIVALKYAVLDTGNDQLVGFAFGFSEY
jgi:hypothetical protein